MIDTVNGTVTATDGRQGVLAGTVTYPDPPVVNRTLEPVRAKVIAYDASPERQALATADTKASVTGIDAKIQQVCGFTRPVNGGYRDYLSMAAYVRDQVTGATTRAALGSPLELVNLFSHDGDRVAHYGNTTMRSVLRGERDELARQVVRKRRGQRYFTIFHEPELHGATPTLYRMALHHIMQVMIEEAQTIGLSPNEFCVGGCLTDSGMVSSDETWWWWDGLDPDLLASNMVGAFWNPYWTAGMTGTFDDRIRRQSNLPYAGGVKRFIVAETAKVGTIAEQVAFIADVDATITRFEGMLELVAFFHSPDGPASGPAQFKGDALVALGNLMKRRNR